MGKPAKVIKFRRKPQNRESSISSEFGALLIEAREQLEVSRQDISSACNVSYQTIWYHETGKASHLPNPDLFWSMIWAYQLTGKEVDLFFAAYGGGYV